MRITIIGCGYVGSALAELAETAQLLDAADPGDLLRALQDSEAAVFCLAPTGDRQVDAAGYEATFLRSMQALAAVVPSLPGLRQLVYTSSCSVYGNAEGLLEEDTPLQPRDRHGEILRESEAVLLGCRSLGRRVAIARLGAIYGPGRELDPRIHALAGKPRRGDGASLTSWIHRDDVVAALAWAVETGFDGIVNLVDDAPIRVRDLVDLTCRAAGLEPVLWEAPAPTGDEASSGRRVSNRRLHDWASSCSTRGYRCWAMGAWFRPGSLQRSASVAKAWETRNPGATDELAPARHPRRLRPGDRPLPPLSLRRPRRQRPWGAGCARHRRPAAPQL